jgi:uncharacterized integral membrane protein
MMGILVAVLPAVLLVTLSNVLAPRVSARAYTVTGIGATLATIGGLMFVLPAVLA